MNDASAQPDRETQAAFARQVLAAEAEAIQRIALTDDFHAAVDLILTRTGDASRQPSAISNQPAANSQQPSDISNQTSDIGHSSPGHLVVSGLGKSGQIGQKISATFASTGTPSHFLHPTEAMHGDLGRIRPGDVVLVLSFGGGTEEVLALTTLLRQDAVPVIAIVGQAASELGRAASHALPVGEVTEACPLQLAPTASTTAMLALGDALALSVSRGRAFDAADFQRYHPGGGLGRQLTPVVQAMRFKAGENLPLIERGLTVEQAYAEAERFAEGSGLRRAGALLVVGPGGALAGMVTDGDLRTALIHQGPAAWRGPVEALMSGDPTTLGETALVRDAVRIVRTRRFDEIPIVDSEGRPIGLIDVQDLAALKVIEG